MYFIDWMVGSLADDSSARRLLKVCSVPQSDEFTIEIYSEFLFQVRGDPLCVVTWA